MIFTTTKNFFKENIFWKVYRLNPHSKRNRKDLHRATLL